MEDKILSFFIDKYNEYCEQEFGEDFEAVDVKDFDKAFGEKTLGLMYTSLESEHGYVELVYAPVSQTYIARLFLEDRIVTCNGVLSMFDAMDLLDGGFMACYDFAVGCFRDLVGEDD